jgi:DNA-binding phage protein
MSVQIELTNRQEKKINELEEELGLSRQQILSAFLEDLLREPDEEFRNRARTIISNNKELNEQLAR